MRASVVTAPVPWIVACCATLVLAGSGVAGAADAFDRHDPAETARAVTPAEWADLALAPCRAAAERLRLDDEALAERLAAPSLAREQAAFLTREQAARAAARTTAIRGGLARLSTLMFGVNPRVAVGGSRAERFPAVLDGLFGGLDACALEAVEATIVIGLFGVPFSADMAANGTPERQFQTVKARIREYVSDGAPFEDIFAAMRPPASNSLVPFVEAVTRAALLVPEASGPPDARTAQRIRAFLEYLTFAVEPIRIQFYLHGKVDALEGALGVALPDDVDEHLFAMARARLYNSVARLRRLRDLPPPAVVAALTPVLDEWFQQTALPALGRALSRDPHAAYWFYVQSGGVVEAGVASTRSHVVVRAPLFALKDLRGLSLETAVARLEQVRLPLAFQQAHAAIEAAFIELTLSRDELRERLEKSAVPPALAARLQAAFRASALSDQVSSIDVFTLLIRDAHLVGERLDRQVIKAGIDLFYAAKSARLNDHVQQALRADPAPDPRLAGYLTTAAALMLELEQRQATDSAFRQATGGGAVGWLRGRYSVGTTVPVVLFPPQGVAGPEFGGLVDALTPKNRESGNDYRGRRVAAIDLVYDGREYYDALVAVVDSAKHFLNISAFDWKTDTGGRDLAYRLMGKKLGIDGADYARFLETFAAGLPIDPAHPAPVAFYDLPTTRVKDLLVWHFVMTSTHPEVVRAREAAREAGATLACATVMTCGDLTSLLAVTGTRFDARVTSAAYVRAWEAYQRLAALFAEGPAALVDVRPKRALRFYAEDADALRRLVRRLGLRRADRPEEPFPISIVADAKQTLFNVRLGERSQQFPYVVTEPVRDIYFMLLEFDVRVVLWKGLVEFPWHAGPVPWPGRKVLGRVPFPFVPWPWLSAVPGFGWANAATSLTLQWVFASDLRIWWASVNHTKSWSNESMALESGMGLGSKYYNEYDTHRTWHDMGVLVRGAVVDDVNDHFVEVFNEARVNNAGLPAARGVPVPRLQYRNYHSGDRADAAADGEPRAWLLTTHPERGDANYRGVYLGALAAARRSILIENSFFSDPLVARMLIRKAHEFRARVNCAGLGNHECAAKRREAVRIHIVLPDLTDKPIVDAVGAADFHEMLHLGIKVHRWNPRQGWAASRMLHTKVWLIDYEPGRGGLAYVGAANATQRSHLADNEAGILSNHPEFARQIHDRIFVPDLTVDSRMESVENLFVVRSYNIVVRGSRWLRRFLVELLWLV